MDRLSPFERRPAIDGDTALRKSKTDRIAAAELSVDTDLRPAPIVESNGEEVRFRDAPISSFTKGLPHDENGNVDVPAYEMFVRALRTTHDAENEGGFPAPLGIENAKDRCWPASYEDSGNAVKDFFFKPAKAKDADTRRWESPLGGLNGVIEGPAPAGVAMAPAPRMGASELCAEMAEIYAMALLRDVPFNKLHDPTEPVVIDSKTTVSVGEVFEQLSNLPWFNPAKHPFSSTQKADGSFSKTLTRYEEARREARWDNNKFTLAMLFRGSTVGAKQGPYLSQFMLQGSNPNDTDAMINFGTQQISQRNATFDAGIDYMTDWHEWLDVQNGADFRNDELRTQRRFLETPRDLASYVQIDQLYQAYFNAALILLDKKASLDHGLPNSSKDGQRKTTREGFATWGGPHLLALFAEVSSRGLKAVRRQKFQIHRRARPEVLAARLAIAHSGNGSLLGDAEPFVQSMLDEMKRDCPDLLKWVVAKNNANKAPKDRALERTDADLTPSPIDPDKNLLLPMAFPEGSPMHAAYGAGHATVAGACVTILKAMFQVTGKNSNLVEMSKVDMPDVKVASKNKLKDVKLDKTLTLQGELDKLAANISIGRNMAGVHYYTDYYDSLRLGERIAVGILEEQLLTTPEKVCMSFDSFDGDRVTITGTPATDSNKPNNVGVTVGSYADFRDWWKLHLPKDPTATS